MDLAIAFLNITAKSFDISNHIALVRHNDHESLVKNKPRLWTLTWISCLRANETSLDFASNTSVTFR